MAPVAIVFNVVNVPARPAAEPDESASLYHSASGVVFPPVMNNWGFPCPSGRLQKIASMSLLARKGGLKSSERSGVLLRNVSLLSSLIEYRLCVSNFSVATGGTLGQSVKDTYDSSDICLGGRAVHSPLLCSAKSNTSPIR